MIFPLGPAILRHVLLSFGSVGLGTAVAVPLGILLARHPGAARWLLSVVGMIQTVPSLAFLALAMPLLGIGLLPALVALFLYSLLPILRNTVTAIQGVDPSLVEAAHGMGMTPRQVLLRVELPLSLPVILTGIRVSTVYMISWATLAAFIGAGGLGDLILAGIATYDGGLIVRGAVPAAALAVLANFLFAGLERLLTPAGLRSGGPERAAGEGAAA